MPSRPIAAARYVVAAALALLALGAVGAVLAAIAGGRFMYELELVETPLARSAPVIDPAPTPRMARRVFLVIIDGLRLDESHELPFINKLRHDGVGTDARSHYPTWSRPNYVSILTGVPPSASGVRTNFHATPVRLDSLMDRARAAKLRVATATDYSPLPRIFLRPSKARPARPPSDADTIESEADLDHDDDDRDASVVHAPDVDLVSPFDDARYAPWSGGFSEAGTALVAGDATLVVMLIGAVDAAGHDHGAASDEYGAAALAADRAVARVLAGVDLAQDVVIVTADHGHTDRGGHGGLEREVVMVPLVAAGRGIRPGATAVDARLIDLAPTVAALLGIAAPGHGLGRTLTELLDLEPGASERRHAADQHRLSVTRGVVETADARAAYAALEGRAWRLTIVAAGAVLAIMIGVFSARRGVLHLDVRVLLVSVPAFFVAYAMLIAILGQRFSPSLVPARGHIAEELLRYGIAGMIVQLLVSMWALRSYRTFADRLAAANGIAWTGLLVTMTLAGASWAFFPPPYVEVPSPVWLVLIPAIQVAVACAAVNVALALLVELVLFLARAWQ